MNLLSNEIIHSQMDWLVPLDSMGVNFNKFSYLELSQYQSFLLFHPQHRKNRTPFSRTVNCNYKLDLLKMQTDWERRNDVIKSFLTKE